MVRIKHRYLLIQILYPSSSSSTSTFPPASAASTTTTTTTAPPPSPLHFHAPTPAHISPAILIQLLRTQISLLYGDYGSGLLLGSNLSVRYFSNATSTAIVRCPRSVYRLVGAACVFVCELPGPTKWAGGERCVWKVVRVSGTIRKCEEAAVRRARGMIDRVRVREGGLLEGFWGGEGKVGEGGQKGEMKMEMEVEDVETSDEG